MGGPMALNLIRAGHEVIIYNRTREKAEPLAKAGARVADSPADAARGCEVVITMLANDQAVREIMLEDGQNAAINGIERGAVHMSSSTISVAFSKQLGEEHAARAQAYIAAPVLGRPESAAEKNLWIVAAGPPQHIERCRPLMEALGRGISIVGDQAWRANLAKLAMNFLIASMLESLGEAFALVHKSGLDEHQFLDIVNAIFSSPVYANYGRIIADKKFEPAGFQLRLGLKDVNLALEAAGDSAVPMPFASVLRDRCLAAIAHGRGEADWAAITEMAAKAAGL
ncbi:MAG: 3-hydroxyisobutyrate dehydrogenase [Bryobacterales bacterium]|nr:3-hydroxyisobutyrate dehydrogenase [Bryobacterales bacterium]